MLEVEKIDTIDKTQVRRFVRIPFRLYANHPCWVPPILSEAEIQLDRKKHPFFEHSDGDFFIAKRDGRDVGRIAVLENKPFNEYHKVHKAQFYFFDCEDDQEAANALFERTFEWAKQRGLDTMVGPKGLSAFDGYGIQVEGFEHRQMMTMMNYNYDYYPRLVESLGFEKEVDFVSCYANTETFQLPERVRRIAERVIKRGELSVYTFKDKNDLKSWAGRIGKMYNDTFIYNWEYYPLTQREIDFVLQTLLTVADPKLLKIILHKGDPIGFLFAFPDFSAALQRARGKLFPFGLIDILLEIRRTKWVSVNGAGVLPEYQGRGGNALLYYEMEKTVKDYRFKHADMTQVAETTRQMRADLINLGGKPYKNHRVYHKVL